MNLVSVSQALNIHHIRTVIANDKRENEVVTTLFQCSDCLETKAIKSYEKETSSNFLANKSALIIARK